MQGSGIDEGRKAATLTATGSDDALYISVVDVTE